VRVSARVALLAAATVLLAGCSEKPKDPPKAAAKPEPVPDVYRVLLDTSQGPIKVEVRKDWAPHAADRFHTLVKMNYYDEARFYRVLRGFIAQFGIHRDPAITATWGQLQMPDDPRRESNRRGTLAFAQSGPNSRTTQVFINLADNKRLDREGFVPFGRIIEGMENADKIFFGYGELAPAGSGPDPEEAGRKGNRYIVPSFPRMDWIKTARLEK
jgi:peptidyl-prolyl cis-trans isomerase A (cyclophilin A)